VIEVQNLVKHYGRHKAVEDVSFSVGSGEVVGFLGPNGAGKSTTMNIVTGYLSASSGTVTIGGDNILEAPERCKSRIGYLPENPPLYTDMTVREYLHFVGALKKVPKPEIRSRIDRGLERVGIAEVRDRLIRNLSKGYRQRVGLAQALMGDPEVLILDEPTIGLDPHQILEIRSLIQSLGEEHTVILSSHILQEVSAVAKRIIIIHDGRIVADGTPESLSQDFSKEGRIYLRVAGAQDKVREILQGVDHIGRVEAEPGDEPGSTEVRVTAGEGKDLRKEIFYALAGADMPLLQLQSENLSLEDIFLKSTMGSGLGAERDEQAERGEQPENAEHISQGE
jgi:ABC-2 type transport system ATP-binding protein